MKAKRFLVLFSVPILVVGMLLWMLSNIETVLHYWPFAEVWISLTDAHSNENIIGAKVFVDNHLVGVTHEGEFQLSVWLWKYGSHDVKTTKLGYADWCEQIMVSKIPEIEYGGPRDLLIEMQPDLAESKARSKTDSQ